MDYNTKQTNSQNNSPQDSKSTEPQLEMISNFITASNTNESIEMKKTNSSNDQDFDNVSVEMLDVELTRQFSESEAHKDLVKTHISATGNDCAALSGKDNEGCKFPVNSITGTYKRNSTLNVRQHHSKHHLHQADDLKVEGTNCRVPCAESNTTACSSSNKVSNLSKKTMSLILSSDFRASY